MGTRDHRGDCRGHLRQGRDQGAHHGAYRGGAAHLDMQACAHYGAIPPAPQVLVKAGAAHLDKPRVLARVSGALRKLSANSEHKHEVIAALMASD